MTVMYGIKNCDTIKKAKIWLQNQNIDFVFHDYRQQGLDAATLQALCNALSWQTLLNTRGTTWRTIEQDRKESLDEQTALALMLEYPALIKRPIVMHQGNYLCGFSAQTYAEFFKTTV
jgi:Spx/MgsR family transcriptional regulator